MRAFLPALYVFLVLCLGKSIEAAPAQPFQTIEGCQYKADRWNDGDSFHVITGDEKREVVVKLYYVDTPEAETAYRDRLDEQAAYFGITRDQATQIAQEAAPFTKAALSKPFTVQTRWRNALGRSALGRIYALVLVRENGFQRAAGRKRVGPHLRHAHRATGREGFDFVSRQAHGIGSRGEAAEKGSVAVHASLRSGCRNQRREKEGHCRRTVPSIGPRRGR